MYKGRRKVVSYAYIDYRAGLWSTLYGYLALDPDAWSRITFYKHGETPGLAEIEEIGSKIILSANHF